ncbi:MAG TPA: DUF2071 domain-containing protein [Pirellulales bacterium]|nr:DUF2071 domain-containing protein [Pirellulales bacterium]
MSHATVDRLSICQRPAGWPVMHQTWSKLLFLHWHLHAEALRSLVPQSLEIDTFEGKAWVSIAPFVMTGIRPPLLPAVPAISDSYELNVRTYVHYEGVPGIWFLSLDASNPLAVVGARATYHLPYFRAQMSLAENGDAIHYRSTRVDAHAPPAEFDAAWTLGAALPAAEPGSLEFFLTERYCLYTQHRRRLYRARIHHDPWPLRRAVLAGMKSTMLEAHGIAMPDHAPLLHAQAEALNVEVWPLKAV